MWIEGRKLGFRDLGFGSKIPINSIPNPQSLIPKTAWFHCASLGEFEQGRPVIEKFKESSYDEHKLVGVIIGYELEIK